MRTPRPKIFTALFLFLAMAAHGQDSQDVDDEASPLDQTVPVADDDAEPPASPAQIAGPPIMGEDLDFGETLTEEQALIEEFARFRELILDKNYDAADASAKRVVEMAIRIHGPQSIETSKALSNLGLVQHNNKQYDAAIQNFTSSIEIIEVVEDRLNWQLVNPLRGLGAAQLISGRPDLAAGSFGRATHITHVNEGPHNIEQVEILESLAEANVRLGDIEEARDVLNRIHALNVRHFDDDAMGLLPSLMRRAEWQHRAGYYNDERATYRRTIRIIETSAGKNDPRLVEPLLKLGETYYYYQPAVMDNNSGVTAAGSGEIFLKRAVRLAESDENYPWLDRATTKLALADYYAYFDGNNRARKIYKEVWDELSTDEERLEVRRELLERPILLREEALPLYTSGGSDGVPGGALKGTIRIDYSVSTRGRVRDIHSQARPAEFTDMQRMVHREIRSRFFRPPMVDGKPVEAPNQVLVHEFSYQKDELDELRSDASDGSDGSDEAGEAIE